MFALTCNCRGQGDKLAIIVGNNNSFALGDMQYRIVTCVMCDESCACGDWSVKVLPTLLSFGYSSYLVCVHVLRRVSGDIPVIQHRLVTEDFGYE